MKILILIILSLFSCSSFGKDINMETVVYEKDNNLEADIWTPKTDQKTYPLVFLVHGGSWSSRHRSDMNKIAKKLSKNGFVAINIAYRLAPKSLFPAPIDDLKSAVVWAKNNSSKYRLDLKRINFWGYSAGSEISTLAALQLNENMPVKSIINGAGPMDLTKYPNDKAIIRYIGSNDSESLKKASPMFFVNKKTPPVFTYHSTNDKIVDFKHAEDFHKELARNKIENEIYPVPGLGHILTFLLSEESLDRSISFLKRHNQ